jgi:hypothetical protein
MRKSLTIPGRSIGPRWHIWHTLGLLAIMAAIVIIGFLIPAASRVWFWLGALSLLATSAFIIGHGITGFWRGVLIDQRNMISLSRLQAMLWTLLILSAFLSAALFNLRSGEADPLLIAIPPGIWVLMSITATSLVGAPLIHNAKMKQDAKVDRAPHTENQPPNHKVDSSNRTTSGQLIVNTSPVDASWADLIRGEEVGNAAQINLGKLQMCYITVILVLVYGFALGSLFASRQSIISTFPDLNEGVLAVLGISHATYLTNKALPSRELRNEVVESSE